MHLAQIIPDAFDDIIPSIGPWVEGLSTDPLAMLFQNLFAFIEIFHIIGLFMLGGAVILTSLRLIGVGLTEVAPSVVAKNVRLWLTIGVIMTIVSGLMIGLSNASKLYSNSAFLYKMIAMVASIIFTYAALMPVAKADGRVGTGPKVGMVIALIVWALGIVVMVIKPGSNVGAFHMLVAGVLVLFAALQGRMRWVMAGGVLLAFLVLQVVTHGFLEDPYAPEYINANRVFMWGVSAFLVVLTLMSIFGKGRTSDSSSLARLIAYSTILAWVMTGAGGRWIGLT